MKKKTKRENGCYSKVFVREQDQQRVVYNSPRLCSSLQKYFLLAKRTTDMTLEQYSDVVLDYLLNMEKHQLFQQETSEHVVLNMPQAAATIHACESGLQVLIVDYFQFH